MAPLKWANNMGNKIKNRLTIIFASAICAYYLVNLINYSLYMVGGYYNPWPWPSYYVAIVLNGLSTDGYVNGKFMSDFNTCGSWLLMEVCESVIVVDDTDINLPIIAEKMVSACIWVDKYVHANEVAMAKKMLNCTDGGYRYRYQIKNRHGVVLWEQ